MDSLMTNQPVNPEADLAKARKLYVKARKKEKQGDYEAAGQYYRQSLTLYEDETVKAAYLNLLATIGPM